KTLTSFKASTLLKDNPDIEKCLFVVDRKDLDRQTRQEFNRFQPGCVEENTNTETLVQRLLSDDYTDKVIVTTIQKLGLALDANHRQSYRQRLEPLRDKRMVTTADIFGKQLHAYTITHAIEDDNVLRFHVDYFKGGGAPIKPGEPQAKQAVVEAILARHDKASNRRRFNALLATASIDDAIAYYDLFKALQAQKQAEDGDD
ncbi:DEAD/DEAH box helicase family protein, partial [Thiolapillus sp.]|uniref:DEAD/DEAH box helicase family protein n=1 Tax=Thiolapillus sp. TaxID=2017437 RepID=UPI003AF90206